MNVYERYLRVPHLIGPTYNMLICLMRMKISKSLLTINAGSATGTYTYPLN